MTRSNAAHGLFFPISAVRTVRSADWWYAKIPPLLAVAYAVLLLRPPAVGVALAALVGTLFSLCSLAAYGYVVNDVFDIEEDRRAGKPNTMARKTPGQRIAACALLAGIGFTPWLVLEFGRAAALVLAVNYLLPTAYSIPPLRLKERGVLGIVADAAGVHAVPALFVATAVSHAASLPGETTFTLVLAAVVWSFFTGLRGIMIHQLRDRERDTQAGATTLGTALAPKQMRGVVRWLVFPVEILAFGWFLWMLFPVAAAALYVAIAYALFDVVKLNIWGVAFDPVPAAPGSYIAPSDLYEVWLPLTLAIVLAIGEPRFLPIVVLHPLMFYREMRARSREVLVVAAEVSKAVRRRW